MAGDWEVGDPLEELRYYQQVVTDDEYGTYIRGSCSTAMGGADPPIRLGELVHSFGDNGYLASSCRQDWSPALQDIARLIQRHLGVGCVDIPEGVDAAVDCRLVEVLDDGSEREVPATEWAVARSGEGCPGGQLRMTDGSEVPTSAKLECAVEP